jgi:hypothetical protein
MESGDHARINVIHFPLTKQHWAEVLDYATVVSS